jgi:hypothetical protein
METESPLRAALPEKPEDLQEKLLKTVVPTHVDILHTTEGGRDFVTVTGGDIEARIAKVLGKPPHQLQQWFERLRQVEGWIPPRDNMRRRISPIEPLIFKRIPVVHALETPDGDEVVVTAFPSIERSRAERSRQLNDAGIPSPETLWEEQDGDSRYVSTVRPPGTVSLAYARERVRYPELIDVQTLFQSTREQPIRDILTQEPWNMSAEDADTLVPIWERLKDDMAVWYAADILTHYRFRESGDAGAVRQQLAHEGHSGETVSRALSIAGYASLDEFFATFPTLKKQEGGEEGDTAHFAAVQALRATTTETLETARREWKRAVSNRLLGCDIDERMQELQQRCDAAGIEILVDEYRMLYRRFPGQQPQLYVMDWNAEQIEELD